MTISIPFLQLDSGEAIALGFETFSTAIRFFDSKQNTGETQMIPASLRWIVDRNPFYVLSACCGLAACWLLGDVSRPDLADVATKVAAVFAYEIAVAVLAVWLAKRVATTRDAAILSVLALTLTADISFFYTQAA